MSKRNLRCRATKRLVMKHVKRGMADSGDIFPNLGAVAFLPDIKVCTVCPQLFALNCLPDSTVCPQLTLAFLPDIKVVSLPAGGLHRGKPATVELSVTNLMSRHPMTVSLQPVLPSSELQQQLPKHMPKAAMTNCEVSLRELSFLPNAAARLWTTVCV